MRQRLIVITALFALTADSPRPAAAGAFATEFTQLLNHAQLVLEYIRQGEQLANELKMCTGDMLPGTARSWAGTRLAQLPPTLAVSPELCKEARRLLIRWVT
jgi:hypothetical protein